MLQQLRGLLVGDSVFLHGSDCTGNSNNRLRCLFCGRTIFNLTHDFCYRVRRFGNFPGCQFGCNFFFRRRHFGIGHPFVNGAVLHPGFYQLVSFFSVNRMLTGNFFLIGHTGKQTELKHTELDAGFVLNLFLKGRGKFGKALVGHDVKDIDVLVLDALAVLVHAQTQATAHFLAAGKGGLLLNQGADLEHVGIVPAFPQRRVGENKPQRTLKAEKPLLVPHDGVVGVIVGLGVALGVLQASFLVLREVAVMYLAYICGESLSE